MPTAWQMTEPSAPLKLTEFAPQEPGPGEARLKVEGCGVCHTDLGFLYGGVRTRKPVPLTLGHEIAGTVEAVGPGATLDSGESLQPGQAVIVPAVLPCGECPICRSGRDNICLGQKMPGNDLDGGFASHILIPTRFLVPVDRMPEGHELPHLAVIADAVTTPYQALSRAEVGEGDSVVVVGAGGVGIFGIQIAAAFGAKVLAVDIAQSRVDQALAHGATAGVCTEGMEDTDARKAVKEAAKQAGFARQGWKVFEMSGSAAGQRLAFSLLTHTGKLGIVGFTMDKVNVRLSNLMAFDAEAFGSWGCSPRHYRAVLDLINEGKVQVKPFVSFHPLAEVNSILEQVHHGQLSTRPVLVP